MLFHSALLCACMRNSSSLPVWVCFWQCCNYSNRSMRGGWLTYRWQLELHNHWPVC